jgi:hypothetical protein
VVVRVGYSNREVLFMKWIVGRLFVCELSLLEVKLLGNVVFVVQNWLFHYVLILTNSVVSVKYLSNTTGDSVQCSCL